MTNCPACGNPIGLPETRPSILRRLQDLSDNMATPFGRRLIGPIIEDVAVLARDMAPDDPGAIGVSRDEALHRLIGRVETPINADGNHRTPYPDCVKAGCSRHPYVL